MNKLSEEPLCLYNEVWKDIPDYEGIYEASNLGRIRTKEGKTTQTKFHGVRRWRSRILKGRGDHISTGKRVSLWKNGKVKDWLVARLIAITFLGKPIGDINTVNHINGNRLDNRLENIEWLSIGDNVRHAFDNGLTKQPRVILYNKEFEKIFRSLAMASIYIGRNKGYISGCLCNNKKITSKDNIEYNVSFLKK